MKSFFVYLWRFVFVLLYPFITVFSLLFTGIIMVLSSLSSFVARFSDDEKKEEKQKREWEAFFSLETLQLRKRKVDEVMFGPAYFQLKASPHLPELRKHIWGHFHFRCFDGALLQKWHSVKEHELEAFDLMYLNPVKRELKKLCTLPTYEWEVRKLDSGQVLIKWFNGKEQLIIKAADLSE